MALKKHHKWLIGSFSTLIIAFMITSSLFMYGIFARQEIGYNALDDKIDQLRIENQASINQLSDSLIETREEVNDLNIELGNIGEEFDLLQASVGEDFSGIIDDAVKGVVTIRTDISQGTGFLLTDDGYLVTNYHVMEGANAATILDYESEQYAVSLIGYEENLDLALLKIEGNFDELKLENSEKVKVGEKVIAIGNPLGLQFSVSQGIVSAVHRPGPNNLEAYIQTDAALNPGNSGGPLINQEGEVIGINNFKVGDSESLGFALESNYIEDFVNELSLEHLGEELI